MNLLPVPSILELPITGPLLVRQNYQHPRLDCGPGLLEGRCLLSLHRELFLSRYTHQQSVKLWIFRPSFDRVESFRTASSYLELPESIS